MLRLIHGAMQIETRVALLMVQTLILNPTVLVRTLANRAMTDSDPKKFRDVLNIILSVVLLQPHLWCTYVIGSSSCQYASNASP